MPRKSKEQLLKERQQKANDKYHRKAMKAITIRFHKEHDKDVIEKLESVENKTDFIRQLIKKELGQS
jgi:hypothetical protein